MESFFFSSIQTKLHYSKLPSLVDTLLSYSSYFAKGVAPGVERKPQDAYVDCCKFSHAPGAPHLSFHQPASVYTLPGAGEYATTCCILRATLHGPHAANLHGKDTLRNLSEDRWDGRNGESNLTAMVGMQLSHSDMWLMPLGQGRTQDDPPMSSKSLLDKGGHSSILAKLHRASLFFPLFDSSAFAHFILSSLRLIDSRQDFGFWKKICEGVPIGMVYNLSYLLEAHNLHKL